MIFKVRMQHNSQQRSRDLMISCSWFISLSWSHDLGSTLILIAYIASSFPSVAFQTNNKLTSKLSNKREYFNSPPPRNKLYSNNQNVFESPTSDQVTYMHSSHRKTKGLTRRPKRSLRCHQIEVPWQAKEQSTKNIHYLAAIYIHVECEIFFFTFKNHSNLRTSFKTFRILKFCNCHDNDLFK